MVSELHTHEDLKFCRRSRPVLTRKGVVSWLRDAQPEDRRGSVFVCVCGGGDDGSLGGATGEDFWRRADILSVPAVLNRKKTPPGYGRMREVGLSCARD